MYTRDRLVWQCVVPHCSARLWTTPAPHVLYIAVDGLHRCFDVTPVTPIYPHLNNRFPVPHLPFTPYHLPPSNPWPHMNPRLPAPSLPSSSTCIASAPKYAESITNSKGFPAIAIDGNVYIKKAQRKNWVTYRCQHFKTLNCSSVCNVDKDMRILKAPGLHSHPICDTLQKPPSTHSTATFVMSR